MKFISILFILLLSQFSMAQDSAFDGLNQLSLEDEQGSEKYIHQGLAQKDYAQLCKKNENKYKDICTEDQAAFSNGFGKTLEVLLPALTKAYALFNTLGGGGNFDGKVLNDKGQQQFKQTNSDGTSSTYHADEAKSPDDKAHTEEKSDYCGYIALVSEAASTAYMLVANEKTEQNYTSEKPEARQAASFYALSDNHKDMAKAAEVQGGVWAATAGCYAIYLSQAAYQGDWKVYAKLGASVFISGFYFKKAKAHKGRAKLLTEMAKDLPQAGDCNPFTQTTCFCNEESSFAVDPGNFNRFCVPELLAQRNQNNDSFVCLDQNGKADVSCACKGSNSCIDRRLSVAGIDIGLGPTVMKNPISAIDPLRNGFGTGNVAAAANRNLALAKKALNTFKPTKAIPLNDTQKGIAKQFNLDGIPKAASAMMSKAKSNKSALPRSLSSFGGSTQGLKGRRSAKKQVTKINPSNFKQGKTIRQKRQGNSGLPSFGRKKKTATGIKIEDFEQKALRDAELIPENGKGIFETISTRYKKRAWNVEFRDVIMEEMNKK